MGTYNDNRDSGLYGSWPPAGSSHPADARSRVDFVSSGRFDDTPDLALGYAPLATSGVRPNKDQKLDDDAKAIRRGRMGGGFRLMLFSSFATLLLIFMLPLALGLPGKVDPWSIGSIANGDVNVTFLDANGDLLAHRGYRQEETVPLAEMPPYLVQAVLAMEDRRFYRHWGVDILGVLRAAQANFAAGGIVEGGSTITQQLARNLYLDGSRTFTRKAQEAALAFWLEQQLTKDEILEL